MDEHVKSVFLMELKKQCEFAIGAIHQVNSALQAARGHDQTPDQSRFHHSEVFRGLHSFLTHTSNISRILWPPLPQKRKKESSSDYSKRCNKLPRVARAKALKAILQLDDAHLLKDRRLRDHLEHYDERLDDWEANSPRRNIVSDMIGDPMAIVGIDDKDRMRTFNPNGARYIFRGEEFDVQEMLNEVEKLQSQLNKEGVR